MGTEVCNSCQRIDGKAIYNKCLLAYILDGKNKLIAVKDELGKILARSVLRLLMDEQSKSPVLFLERIYTCQNTEELSDLIREGALRKAKALGLPLVASSRIIKTYAILPPIPTDSNRWVVLSLMNM